MTNLLRHIAIAIIVLDATAVVDGSVISDFFGPLSWLWTGNPPAKPVVPPPNPAADAVPNRFTGATQPPQPPNVRPDLLTYWIGDYPENFPKDESALEDKCFVEGYIYESHYVFVQIHSDLQEFGVDSTPRPHVTVLATRQSNQQCLVIGTFTMMAGWSDIEGRARTLFPLHTLVRCGPNHRIDNRYCNKQSEPWLTWNRKKPLTSALEEEPVVVASSSDSSSP
jgi:hypothetical protein